MTPQEEIKLIEKISNLVVVGILRDLKVWTPSKKSMVSREGLEPSTSGL